MAALALSSCAGLNALPRSPDRDTVADLLRIATDCLKPDEAGACAPADRVTLVSLDNFSCDALPVRAGMQEIRRARCVFAATATTPGGLAPLAVSEGEFGLVNFALGSRIGQYRWVMTPPAKK